MKRKLKKLGVVLLGLAVVGLIASGIAGIVFTRQLNAEMAAIKFKGEPTTLEELTGRPIPDSQNAAVLYTRLNKEIAANAYKQDWKVVESALDHREVKMDADTKKRLSAALGHMQPLLDLIEEAAAKPRCRFKANPVTGRADIMQPARLWRPCQLLHARVLLNAQTGNITQAVKDIVTQFRVPAQETEGVSLLGEIMRVGVISIAAQTILDAARYGSFSEGQARSAYDAVAQIDLTETFRQDWLSARVGFLSPDDTVATNNAQSVLSRMPDPVGFIYARTLFRGDQAVCLRLIARHLDGVKLEYPQAVAEGLFDESRNVPAYAILTRILSPVFARSSLLRFEFEEQLARTQVFLALQGYKARYGGYPATMQELKSKLGWKLPVDPFSGKDFIYKKQAKGFMLYSVGPDMKDDGGRSLGDHVGIESKGDIVLRWDK